MKWISVKDRLPKNSNLIGSKSYLCYIPTPYAKG